MLAHVMLTHVMLAHVTLARVMLSHVMLAHVITRPFAVQRNFNLAFFDINLLLKMFNLHNKLYCPEQFLLSFLLRSNSLDLQSIRDIYRTSLALNIWNRYRYHSDQFFSLNILNI
jgi:hypothetical protein